MQVSVAVPHVIRVTSVHHYQSPLYFFHITGCLKSRAAADSITEKATYHQKVIKDGCAELIGGKIFPERNEVGDKGMEKRVFIGAVILTVNQSRQHHNHCCLVPLPSCLCTEQTIFTTETPLPSKLGYLPCACV